MGYQFNVDDQTVERLRTFVGMLNEEYERGSVIVVEGRRDAEALAKVGFTGSPAVFHHFKGIADFLDCHDDEKKKMILLLDMDRTGKHLTRKLVSQLQSRRQSVTLFYKHAFGQDNQWEGEARRGPCSLRAAACRDNRDAKRSVFLHVASHTSQSTYIQAKKSLLYRIKTTRL